MQTLSQDEGRPRPEEIVLQDTYRLVRQIGFGGMGVVYEATHARLPGRFAVKVLLRSLLSNLEAFARFCQEAQIMSELRHPHVVQIVDFNYTAEKQPYFVMEYLEGRDLAAQLADVGPMEIEHVVPIVAAVASALGAAHRRGIIHRDLKPSNIFLCEVEGEDADREEPFVKVLDFGVSKVNSAAPLTLNKKPLGTPQYMAPEQALGRVDEIDGHTDQFALAAITYEMLTGQDAFRGEDPAALLYQIVHAEPQPLSRHIAGNCTAIQAVLSRALAKDPAARFPTITAFAAAFREAAKRAHPRAVPMPAPATATAPVALTGNLTGSLDRVPRSPYRAIALALVAAALAMTLVAKGWGRTLPDDIAITTRGLMARATHRPPLPQPELSRPAPPPPPAAAVP